MRLYFGEVVGLVVMSALLAGCGSKSETATEEESKPTKEESLAAIKKLKGWFDNGGKALSLDFTKVTDAGLVHLEGLTGLKSLTLSFTDNGVENSDHLVA
jgi:hypothetical protein